VESALRKEQVQGSALGPCAQQRGPGAAPLVKAASYSFFNSNSTPLNEDRTLTHLLLGIGWDTSERLRMYNRYHATRTSTYD